MSIRNRRLKYLREAAAAEKQAAEASITKEVYLRLSQQWKLLAKLSEKISHFSQRSRESLFCRHRQAEFRRRRKRAESEAAKFHNLPLSLAFSKITTQWKILERTCEKFVRRRNLLTPPRYVPRKSQRDQAEFGEGQQR